MDRLFHIVAAGDWARAAHARDYRPDSLSKQGFVHCSFADQVAGTAELHYAGVAGLVVLEIDAALLDVPVVVEDSAGSGTSFPHVYGPIPVTAVRAVHQLSALSGDSDAASSDP